MTIDSLIKKYEDKVTERYYKLGIIENELSKQYYGRLQREKEDIVKDIIHYQEILQDLRELKKGDE